jgi:hypothetical protein
LLLLYLLFAYLLLPLWWRQYTRGQGWDDHPTVTRTRDGISGDPLNVALVGTQDEVIEALTAAGWYPADPTTWRSSVRIVSSVMLRRAYHQAPMSNLYLWGRSQDLAFQRPFSKSPAKRHHVRFWLSEELTEGDRPLWLGAATFDQRVGFSHRTGQITHHVAAKVDEERDTLINDLKKGDRVVEVRYVDGAPCTGCNGGGDRYVSDGKRAIVFVRSPGKLASLP